MFTTLQDAVMADSHLCLIRGHGVSISFHFRVQTVLYWA